MRKIIKKIYMSNLDTRDGMTVGGLNGSFVFGNFLGREGGTLWLQTNI